MVKLVRALNEFESQTKRDAKAVYVSPEIYQRLRSEMVAFGHEPVEIAGKPLKYSNHRHGNWYFT